MDEKELNQTELSKLSGVGKSHISQYLSGKCEPRGKTRTKLEEALEMAFDDAVSMSPPVAFSTRSISAREAARILHMDEQRLINEMESGKLNIGHVSRTVGSNRRSIYVSPKLLYELTGYYRP